MPNKNSSNVETSADTDAAAAAIAEAQTETETTETADADNETPPAVVTEFSPEFSDEENAQLTELAGDDAGKQRVIHALVATGADFAETMNALGAAAAIGAKVKKQAKAQKDKVETHDKAINDALLGFVTEGLTAAYAADVPAVRAYFDRESLPKNLLRLFKTEAGDPTAAFVRGKGTEHGGTERNKLNASMLAAAGVTGFVIDGSEAKPARIRTTDKPAHPITYLDARGINYYERKHDVTGMPETDVAALIGVDTLTDKQRADMSTGSVQYGDAAARGFVKHGMQDTSNEVMLGTERMTVSEFVKQAVNPESELGAKIAAAAGETSEE